MDISKLRPVRISPSAREKVMLDFYPELGSSAGVFYADKTFDDRSQAMHAGALCLYATMLITKIHETNPFDLEPYYKEREESYKTLIKNHPKHASLSDEQVATFARNLIERDIRNSFAHGNFEISYDVYTKKIVFCSSATKKRFCNR